MRHVPTLLICWRYFEMVSSKRRYEEITGFKVPCKFDSKEKFRKNAIKIAGDRWRKLNQDARQIIKAELVRGPNRHDGVSQYLGAI